MEQAQREADAALKRPEVNTPRVILWASLFVLAGVAAFVAAWAILAGRDVSLAPLWALGIAAAVWLVLFGLLGKPLCKNLVLVYQKHAPARVRRACVFEPSCSEYMLLAIDKYGAFRGVLKGLRRLTRCHDGNGGEDYP